jgi:acetyl-CoA C-acetyltransferase
MANDNDVVIVAGARTPFGRFGGSLINIDYYELGAIPMREVIKRTGIKPELVNEVFWGVGDTSACRDVYTPVAGRQSLIKAGLPHETVSISFDMACVSAMNAVRLAALEMKAEEIEVAICGGATSFGQSPLVVRGVRHSGFRLGDVKMEDPLYALGYKDFNPVSVDSDDVAFEYGFTRQDMDEWAARSHQKYGEAWNAGKFKEEIIPMTIPQAKGDPKTLDIDEQYRPGTTMEGLARLKPVYNTRAITAGNAPGLNDGASAVVVASRAFAEQKGLKPIARVIGYAQAAVEPKYLFAAPAKALPRLLEQVGWTLKEVDLIELNEAFAAQVLADGYALKDQGWDWEKVNVNGGAIALGHPIGASGARVLTTLIYALKQRNLQRGVASLCLGGAEAVALAVEIE